MYTSIKDLGHNPPTGLKVVFASEGGRNTKYVLSDAQLDIKRKIP